MANIHTLETMGDETKVVVHFPTPAGSNSVGVSWQIALINSGIGGTTILRDGDGNSGTISAAEKLQIENGEIIEVVDWIRLPTFSGSASERNTWITQEFNRIRTKFLSNTGDKLRFFGATR